MDCRLYARAAGSLRTCGVPEVGGLPQVGTCGWLPVESAGRNTNRSWGRVERAARLWRPPAAADGSARAVCVVALPVFRRPGRAR